MSATTTPENPKRPLSEKQLAARRSNARKSTGPRTPEGKARSSQNARKHGFFTQTALLFYESPEDFVALRDAYIDEYCPQTPTEWHCVMEMANAQFRLRRVRGLEADLFQILITRELPSRGLSNGEMQAQAFRTLADTSRALHLLQRYEVMFRRQYERALRTLWEHRDRQRRLTDPLFPSPSTDVCPPEPPASPIPPQTPSQPAAPEPPAQKQILRNEPKPAASPSIQATSSPPSPAARPPASSKTRPRRYPDR